MVVVVGRQQALSCLEIMHSDPRHFAVDGIKTDSKRSHEHVHMCERDGDIWEISYRTVPGSSLEILDSPHR